MRPLYHIVEFFMRRHEAMATAVEINAEFGDVTDELDHLVQLGILSVHGWDRSRYWFKRPKISSSAGRKSWYSAEKKIQSILARRAERRAA